MNDHSPSTAPIAVVTGASRGVGLAVSLALADAGYRVKAHYRSAVPEGLDGNGAIEWWQADFTRPLAGQVPSFEQVDALVHCAGVCSLGTTESSSRAEWEHHMTVNLHAPVELTQMLLPQLRQSRGQVIYINSGAGKHANPNWGAYAASKFAARAWCDALRAEESLLRVTGIFPGRIDTDMQRAIVASEGGTYDPAQFLAPETVARSVLHALNTPKDGHIHEIILRPGAH